MSGVNMYSVAVVASLSQADELFNFVVLAPSKEAALEQALVTLPRGAAEPKTGRWRIVTSAVKQVDRELLARAATEILGWSAPEDNKKKGSKK